MRQAQTGYNHFANRDAARAAVCRTAVPARVIDAEDDAEALALARCIASRRIAARRRWRSVKRQWRAVRAYGWRTRVAFAGVVLGVGVGAWIVYRLVELAK